MQKRIAFVVGAAVGYVVGTRVGREGYKKIVEGAKDLWESPPVQKGVASVQSAVGQKSPEAAEKIGTASEKIGDAIDAESAATESPEGTPAHD
jgi:hypothetical protein